MRNRRDLKKDMRTLVILIGTYTEKMNIFKKELLVTEKSANNILVYNVFSHPALITLIDFFFSNAQA